MSKRQHNEKNYHHPEPGEWVQMSLPPFVNFDSCCGCGLVHRVEYALRPITSGKNKGQLTLWRRMYLDDESTNRIRQQRLKAKEFRQLDGYIIAFFPVPKRKKRKSRK